MIEKIEISNFKSIDTLELDLGRFNVFIGDNGSGKSNILEAVAFGTAAASNKLDDEFLSNRGIRVTSPELMVSSFIKKNKRISISFQKEGKRFIYEVEQIDKENSSKWENVTNQRITKLLNTLKESIDTTEQKTRKKLNENFWGELSSINEALGEEKIDFNKLKYGSANENIEDAAAAVTVVAILYSLFMKNKEIKDYLIFSPNQIALRSFNVEGQIKPLGKNGEGIFNLLREIFEDKNPKELNEIKDNLQIIDWFKDIDIQYDSFGDKSIKVSDRFFNVSDKSLNQYSVNEGFLYILFYFLLFKSNKTPNFFAIDNLDVSFHPKLCEELTKTLSEITVKKKKQVLLTTHSPFVLDGLDLNNKDIRLFVVFRNRLGVTKVERITPLKSKMKLSEAWMKGFLGGMPKTFV